MPTYEYRCPKGHHFELFQKMSERPRAMCPECGTESERRISGGLGFLFKGDGFYVTENRSDSYKKDASKEEAGPLPGKGTSEKPEKVGEGPSTTAKAKDSGSTSPPVGGIFVRGGVRAQCPTCSLDRRWNGPFARWVSPMRPSSWNAPEIQSMATGARTSPSPSPPDSAGPHGISPRRSPTDSTLPGPGWSPWKWRAPDS